MRPNSRTLDPLIACHWSAFHWQLPSAAEKQSHFWSLPPFRQTCLSNCSNCKVVRKFFHVSAKWCMKLHTLTRKWQVYANECQYLIESNGSCAAELRRRMAYAVCNKSSSALVGVKVEALCKSVSNLNQPNAFCALWRECIGFVHWLIAISAALAGAALVHTARLLLKTSLIEMASGAMINGPKRQTTTVVLVLSWSYLAESSKHQLTTTTRAAPSTWASDHELLLADRQMCSCAFLVQCCCHRFKVMLIRRCQHFPKTEWVLLRWALEINLFLLSLFLPFLTYSSVLCLGLFSVANNLVTIIGRSLGQSQWWWRRYHRCA